MSVIFAHLHAHPDHSKHILLTIVLRINGRLVRIGAHNSGEKGEC